MPKRRKHKQWYHSKTIWFNVIMTISGIAVVVTPHVPEQWTALTMSIQGIGNLVLRVWFTSSSISNEPAETPVESTEL
jgi:Mg2+/citrate symporter